MLPDSEIRFQVHYHSVGEEVVDDVVELGLSAYTNFGGEFDTLYNVINIPEPAHALRAASWKPGDSTDSVIEVGVEELLLPAWSSGATSNLPTPVSLVNAATSVGSPVTVLSSPPTVTNWKGLF